jgi:hypothetical protein
VKGRSTAGVSPARASRQRSPVANRNPVRDRAGRGWLGWVKAAVWAADSGAAQTRSGVEEMACSNGRSVNWETLPHP